MIYYREEKRSNSQIVGGIATLLYAVLLLLLLLFVKFTMDVPEEQSGGIMINFGNVDEAAPGSDMAMSDELAQSQVAQQLQASDQTDLLTQDFEEAPTVQQKAKPTPKPKIETTTPIIAPKPTTQPPAEKPREVNRQALFPGRTAGSTSASDGTGAGKGNQGDLAGTPEGSYDGTGNGTGGGSASLSGRTLSGALPRPDYGVKDQGRVVVDITVDQHGKVIAASYRPVGSTTQNSTLVAAAIRAANQARFNVDDNAPISQKGTITYIFKMQ